MTITETCSLALRSLLQSNFKLIHYRMLWCHSTASKLSSVNCGASCRHSAP